MKKFLLLAVLAVSASAFAANTADLVGELQALDAEYQNLASQEEARFNEERAQADAARQALAQNEQVYNELSQRAQRLQAEANTRFYKSQYQDLASKYEDALKKLEAEMEQQKGVISDFEKIQKHIDFSGNTVFLSNTIINNLLLDIHITDSDINLN